MARQGPAAMHLFYRLFATINSFAPTILRLVLATVFFVHSGQKTFGWMNGPGWNATLTQLTAPAGLNLSTPVAVASILAEMVGAMGMLLGFCTRLTALLILGTMTVAAGLIPWQAVFLAPNGFEYPLMLGGISLALAFCGGGRFSMDRALTRQILPPHTGTVMGSYRMQSIIKG